MKSASKSKQRAFAFYSGERTTESEQRHDATTYTTFREMQKEAHRKGVKDGQDLFEKYMPRSCVDLLKANGRWDLPYKCEHPSGLQIVNGQLPSNYNKLDLDVSAGSLVEDTELELLKERDEEESEKPVSHS